MCMKYTVVYKAETYQNEKNPIHWRITLKFLIYMKE